MDIFTITEEVLGDYGVLTLTAPGSGYAESREYDLSVEDFKMVTNELVAKFVRVILED